jgi:LAO/AO transport system kinase
LQDVADRALGGEIRAIARLISMVENDAPEAVQVMSAIFHRTGRAAILGITGAPGAGKSTLVDGLVGAARSIGQSVAVLAVDPSSPFTGGAILGDRIRMQTHAYDERVFIRSLGARGQLGGLTRSTRKAIHVLDAAGYDTIFVETVGVGQSELDIAGAADTTIVVLTPGMGDTVQTLKAGILEIADVFALNKADQDGAPQTLRSLRGMLQLGQTHDSGWLIPIVETRAHQATGIDMLWRTARDHREYLESSGQLIERRASRLKVEVIDLVERGLRSDVMRRLVASPEFDAIVDSVRRREHDPDTAARAILQGVRASPEHIGQDKEYQHA